MTLGRETANLGVQVTTLECWGGGNISHLPSNKTYSLTIDYPLSTPAVIPIKTGKSGIGFVALMRKIGEAYRKVYAKEDAAIAKGSENDRYGIWGHSIGDLVIEGISVDHKAKTIKLTVGS